jgi:hypothetical protein
MLPRIAEALVGRAADSAGALVCWITSANAEAAVPSQAAMARGK